jgi:hypothetical protein
VPAALKVERDFGCEALLSFVRSHAEKVLYVPENQRMAELFRFVPECRGRGKCGHEGFPVHRTVFCENFRSQPAGQPLSRLTSGAVIVMYETVSAHAGNALFFQHGENGGFAASGIPRDDKVLRHAAEEQGACAEVIGG